MGGFGTLEGLDQLEGIWGLRITINWITINWMGNPRGQSGIGAILGLVGGSYVVVEQRKKSGNVKSSMDRVVEGRYLDR